MQKIVITGCGVVSSIGIGMEAFSESLSSCRSGISQASFRGEETSPNVAGEIKDLHIERFFESKSLGRLGKTTLLIIMAGKIAMEDASLAIDKGQSFHRGLIMGSHHGEFDIRFWTHGKIADGKPQLVSPNRFLYGDPNMTAGEVCIRLGIRGHTCFLSDGNVSSTLSTVGAYQRLKHNSTETCYLAGGTDSISKELYEWYRLSRSLATNDGNGEFSRPFDKRGNGLVMGEGAGMLVLERSDLAVARNARIRSEIAGCAVVSSVSGREESGAGISEAMTMAMKRAELEPSEIGAILANANSTEEDELEAMGIRNIFKGKDADVPITSLKSLVGETFGASGALNIAAGISIIESGFIFPAGDDGSSYCGINVLREAFRLKKPNIIINSISRTHMRTTNVSMVLRRYAP